jgi:hypothetical protein
MFVVVVAPLISDLNYIILRLLFLMLLLNCMIQITFEIPFKWKVLFQLAVICYQIFSVHHTDYDKLLLQCRMQWQHCGHIPTLQIMCNWRSPSCGEKTPFLIWYASCDMRGFGNSILLLWFALLDWFICLLEHGSFHFVPCFPLFFLGCFH